MSDSGEFKRFTHLSQELQDMIWTYSLTPQIISLQLTKNTSTQHASPSIGNDGSHPGAATHSSISIVTLGRLKLIDAGPPAAYSVSRASRAFTKSKGYKAWKMMRSDGKVRDVIWNPLMDTVFFDMVEELLFNIFVRHFSAQVHEMRNLALPNCYWVSCFVREWGLFRRRKLKRGSRLLLMLLARSSLKNVFVMVDKAYFERKVKGIPKDELEFWNAPGTSATGFHGRSEAERKRDGLDAIGDPKVSAVWNFDMILDEKDVILPECFLMTP